MVEKIEGRLAFSAGRGYDEDMRKNHLQNLLQNRVPPAAAEGFTMVEGSGRCGGSDAVCASAEGGCG